MTISNFTFLTFVFDVVVVLLFAYVEAVVVYYLHFANIKILIVLLYNVT